MASARASSFGRAVQFFRERNRRVEPRDEPDTFELVYIALYHGGGGDFGETAFFDVKSRPPRHGPPMGSSRLSFESVIRSIHGAYQERNDPQFLFDDGKP